MRQVNHGLGKIDAFRLPAASGGRGAYMRGAGAEVEDTLARQIPAA